MKPHSEEKDIQYLTSLIRAQYDPDAAEPPPPPRRGQKQQAQDESKSYAGRWPGG